MKYLHKFLLPFCMLLAGGGFTNCSDDKTEPKPDQVPTATLAIGTVGTNSAEMELTTKNVGDFAYMVSSNPAEEAPVPAVLFASGKVVPATDGVNKFTIKDLEAESTYRVFIAIRSGEKFGEEVITSGDVKTGKYSQFLTIIESDAFDAIKFHIEVPTGKTIGWAAIDYDQFIGQAGFGTIIPNYLWQEKGKVDVVTESQTVTFKGYTGFDDEGNEILYSLGASQPLVVFAAEVETGEDPYGEGEAWVPKFDYNQYMEDMMGGGGDDPGPLSVTRAAQEFPRDYDKYWTTDYYAAYLTTVRPWEKYEAKCEIEVKAHTLKSITLGITPDPKTYDWGWQMVDTSTFDMMVEQYGGEANAIFYLAQYAEAHTGAADIKISDLEEGFVYRLIIVNSGDAAHTQVGYQLYDFEAGKPTKDPAKVIVKGITAPEGEVASPWMVWFNVKAPNKDVVSAAYLAESTTEFVHTLNQGLTYTTMFNTAGFPNAFSDSDVAAINSDAGLNINFDCWEDTDNRLAVQVVNDEEVATNPDTDPDAVADMRSSREPDAPRVESELFSSLKGDWTLTADVLAYYYKWNEDHTRQELGWWPSTKKVKVTISGEPAYPSPMPKNVYELYPNKTKEQVDALYTDFKASSTKFAEKTRGQNRLLCEGLDLNASEEYYGDYSHYYSPWDLFISPDYGAARINDDLFVDFGPKWFLQIGSNGKVIVNTDYSRITRVMTSNATPYYLVGVTPKDDSYEYIMADHFPVTVSADGNTLTIEPYTADGKDYTLTLATIDNGYANTKAVTTSTVMTKGWTEPAPTALAKRNAASAAVAQPIAPADGKGINSSKVYPRTWLGGAPAQQVGPREQITGKVFDISVMKNRYEKSAKALQPNLR